MVVTDRHGGLDALRAWAAGAVVVIHVAATAMQRARPGSVDWWAADFYHALAVWAVPVFVMISGALLLDPRRPYTVRDFLARRAGRILVPLVFWSSVYLGARFHRGEVGAVQAGVDLLFGMPSAHLWYLFMAAGLYLATPPLRAFLAAASQDELRYATLFALFVGMAANLTGYLIGLPSPLAVVLFVPFIGYYLLGHALRPASPRRPLLLAIVALAASFLTAVGTGLVGRAFPGFPGWKILCDQLSPTVMVAATAIFLLAPAIEHGGGRSAAALRRAGKWLAPYALGVYVIHPLVMQALEEWAGLSIDSLGAAVGVPVVSATVFAISLIASWLIGRLPGARMVIGLNGKVRI